MSTVSRAWRGARADWKLHLLSAFSSAVAFVCLAAALLVVFNLESMRARWARTGRASVFLRDGTSEQTVTELRRALEQMPAVTSVRHVSSSDARAELLGDAPDSVLSALPPDAFPASLEIEVDSSLSDADLASVTGKLQRIPAIESVETYQRHTDKLRSLLHTGVGASVVLAFIVLASVISVVASTVRLALQRRRIEIEVLRLVGATEPYVRRPFVIEGAVQGALGAVAATVMLGVFYLVVREHVSDFLKLLLGTSSTFLPWYAVVGLVMAGAVLGAVASHLSLKRMVTV